MLFFLTISATVEMTSWEPPQAPSSEFNSSLLEHLKIWQVWSKFNFSLHHSVCRASHVLHLISLVSPPLASLFSHRPHSIRWRRHNLKIFHLSAGLMLKVSSSGNNWSVRPSFLRTPSQGKGRVVIKMSSRECVKDVLPPLLFSSSYRGRICFIHYQSGNTSGMMDSHH